MSVKDTQDTWVGVRKLYYIALAFPLLFCVGSWLSNSFFSSSSFGSTLASYVKAGNFTFPVIQLKWGLATVTELGVGKILALTRILAQEGFYLLKACGRHYTICPASDFSPKMVTCIFWTELRIRHFSTIILCNIKRKSNKISYVFNHVEWLIHSINFLVKHPKAVNKKTKALWYLDIQISVTFSHYYTSCQHFQVAHVLLISLFKKLEIFSK